MAWLMAHSSVVLMVLLTLSEVLAIVAPAGWGGVIASIITALKALGAKNVDGQ